MRKKERLTMIKPCTSTHEMKNRKMGKEYLLSHNLIISNMILNIVLGDPCGNRSVASCAGFWGKRNTLQNRSHFYFALNDYCFTLCLTICAFLFIYSFILHSVFIPCTFSFRVSVPYCCFYWTFFF